MFEPDHVRPPSVAGLFYPGDPGHLAVTISELLDAADTTRRSSGIRALLVPHAGYAYSGKTAGSAYGLLDHGERITRVILLAPSHHVGFRGVDPGIYAAFETPLGRIPVMQETERALHRILPDLVSFSAEAHADEHALEVQLPFVQTTCPNAAVLPLLCGACRDEDLARLEAGLTNLIPADEETLWIVSSDLTHFGPAFGYVPFRDHVFRRLEELDRGALAFCLAKDPVGFRDYLRRTGMTLCGAVPLELLLRIMNRIGPDWRGDIVAYATSGELEGDTTHSVGYAAMTFRTPAGHSPTACGLDDAAGAILVQLARQAVTDHLRGISHADAAHIEIPPILHEPGACFVTLTTHEGLRGCVGSLEADRPLAAAVRDGAEEAAFRDPRFLPVRENELADLRFEVSVLTPLRAIGDIAEFEPGRHGIVIEKGKRSAVFLPVVAAEHGWDRETTLRKLCRKAGLPDRAWRSRARLLIFEAQCFAEPRAPAE